MVGRYNMEEKVITSASESAITHTTDPDCWLRVVQINDATMVEPMAARKLRAMTSKMRLANKGTDSCEMRDGFLIIASKPCISWY